MKKIVSSVLSFVVTLMFVVTLALSFVSEAEGQTIEARWLVSPPAESNYWTNYQFKVVESWSQNWINQSSFLTNPVTPVVPSADHAGRSVLFVEDMIALFPTNTESMHYGVFGSSNIAGPFPQFTNSRGSALRLTVRVTAPFGGKVRASDMKVSFVGSDVNGYFNLEYNNFSGLFYTATSPAFIGGQMVTGLSTTSLVDSFVFSLRAPSFTARSLSQYTNTARYLLSSEQFVIAYVCITNGTSVITNEYRARIGREFEGIGLTHPRMGECNDLLIFNRGGKARDYTVQVSTNLATGFMDSGLVAYPRKPFFFSSTNGNLGFVLFVERAFW